MIEIIVAIGGLISALGLGTYLGAFLNKKKYNQEVELLRFQAKQSKETAENASIDNDIKLSVHYKEILDDLKVRYENRYKEFEGIMLRKVELLEQEITLKNRKIKLQQQEIIELKKENRSLKKENANNNSPR